MSLVADCAALARREIILENTNLRLQVRPASVAKEVRVTLEDRRTGLRFSAPLAEAGVMWDAIHREEWGEPVEIRETRDTGDGAIRFRCATKRSRIGWVLELRLEERRLAVRIPWESVREERCSQFRLMGIYPLPGLLHGAGTFAVPLKSGGLVEPSRLSECWSERLLIYGSQPRHEELPLLPLAGYYEEERGGLAAIVGSGECDAFFEMTMHGEGTASAGFSLAYRHGWPSPVDPVDRELFLYPLERAEAHYSALGRLYHDFLKRENGVSTLEEKMRRSPGVEYLARSMVFKTFHGMKEMDHEHGNGRYHLHQSFAETAVQLRRLKESGIDLASIQLVGWNYDGHDGAYPHRFPVDPRPGGEAGFRELIRSGQALGFQMQVHDNFADSVDRNRKELIRRSWGEPVCRGIWGGGAIYALNPMKSGEAAIAAEMERVKALGVEGVYYLDAFAAPLEEDFSPPAPRSAHARGMAWTLGVARSVFGACGTEMGFAHIAREADYIASSPLRHHLPLAPHAGALHRAVSEWVPLWQMAFHGLLAHALIDTPVPSLSRLLEAAETGALPRCDFTGANPGGGAIFAVQWGEELLPIFKAKYDLLLGEMAGNQPAPMVAHRRIGERAYETTFANGCRVAVDYATGKLWRDEREVAIPPVFDARLSLRTQ